MLKLGVPVYKRHLGYDITQLFIGSEGALGIITKAVLRVISLPGSITRFLAFFDRQKMPLLL